MTRGLITVEVHQRVLPDMLPLLHSLVINMDKKIIASSKIQKRQKPRFLLTYFQTR
jgi:hypothetical protein